MIKPMMFSMHLCLCCTWWCLFI